ncbi:MAG: fructose-bisphosphatase class III, partial [Chloroflexota bacterium]
MTYSSDKLAYLELLAQHYPTIRAASTEIINLVARLQLPKGTEHFVSDIHGEYEAFHHVLKTGSGSIGRYIDELFVYELTEQEKSNLEALICYPEEKLPELLALTSDRAVWFRITIFRLIKLCRRIASKYSRAYVRSAIEPDFAAVIEELLH